MRRSWFFHLFLLFPLTSSLAGFTALQGSGWKIKEWIKNNIAAREEPSAARGLQSQKEQSWNSKPTACTVGLFLVEVCGNRRPRLPKVILSDSFYLIQTSFPSPLWPEESVYEAAILCALFTGRRSTLGNINCQSAGTWRRRWWRWWLPSSPSSAASFLHCHQVFLFATFLFFSLYFVLTLCRLWRRIRSRNRVTIIQVDDGYFGMHLGCRFSWAGGGRYRNFPVKVRVETTMMIGLLHCDELPRKLLCQLRGRGVNDELEIFSWDIRKDTLFLVG